jgi:hypothetical protein
MNILCESVGVRIGRVIVPAFTLRNGDWIVLRWPEAFGTDSEDLLYEALGGVSIHAGLRRYCEGKVVTAFGKWAERSFAGCGTVGALLEALRPEARKVFEPQIRARHLPPGAPLSHLPATPRVLGGLMLASLAKEIVVFNTSGLDPMGARTVYAYVAAELAKGAGFIEVEFLGVAESEVRPAPVGIVEAHRI